MTVANAPGLRRLSRSGTWIAGVVGCLLLGVLYFFSRTEVHTFDALSYTWALEAKPFGLLFHPHHVLYGPVGWLAYHVALGLGYTGRADIPVQLVNSLAGALGVFFFWRFGARWTGRPVAALGVALLVGLSYAYWLYAAEVEVYTLATAFITLSMWLLVILDERPGVGWSVALGLAHAGAILFHQTSFLFGAAILVFILSRSTLRRPVVLVGYGLGVLLPVIVAYGYVAYSSQFSDWNAFYLWFTDYAQSGQWGGFLSLNHFPALRSGLQTTVSNNAGLAAAVYILAAAGIAGGVIQAWRDANRRSWVLFAAIWTIVYLLFFWWWEPWNIEFWIATLPLTGLWILSAWPTTPPTETRGASPRQRYQRLARAAYAVIPFGLAALLTRAHYDPIQQMGDANEDYYRQVTIALEAVIQPEELVITRGNVLDLYVPFYARHPYILSLRQLEQGAAGDRAQIMGELVGQLDWALVTGRPFLIDQFILDEPREPIRNPFGLLPEEIEMLRARYPLVPMAPRGEQPLFYGTSRYDNIGRTAWDFSESLQGWSTWGINEPRFENGGWCFSGGSDPQMKGPQIDIEAASWDRLTLDMTIDAKRSYAQLFWRSNEAEYSSDQSLEMPLQQGRRSYDISLSAAPGWEGTIASIRIDPVPGDEEATVCVHGVRFSAADEG